MTKKFVQSPYFSSRGNWKITGIVIHTTVGAYQGVVNYFQNNDRLVSAHYVVKEDGTEVTQMVDEAQAAHHAGIISNPSTPVYRGSNPNFYTIGIENADYGDPHGADRTQQIKTLAALVKEICERWGIPIDKDHICGHRELYDKKTCPGNINVDEVIALAGGTVAPVVPVWLKTMFQEIGISLDRPEGEIRGKVDEVISAFRRQPELLKQLEENNIKIKDLIVEADTERNKARDYKEKFDNFLLFLAQKLDVSVDEVAIKNEIDVLIKTEDKVTELQKQLKTERETYETKLKELTKNAESLQSQVNTLVGELEKLKKEHPELPIEIPVVPRKFWNILVDFIRSIIDRFKLQ